MTYAEKLRDPRWQKKRLKILNRDGFKCRDCGGDNKTLHVHHCHYAKGDPWKTPDGCLLSLCEDCHSKRQFSENILKEEFGTLLANLSDECRVKLFECFQMLWQDPDFSEGVIIRDAYSSDWFESMRWYLALDHLGLSGVYKEVIECKPGEMPSKQCLISSHA